MSKTRAIAYVIFGVSLSYIPLGVFIKFLADTSVSVNADLAAGSNMSNYPGTSGFLLNIPWILYFAPVIIGIVLIVIILKRRAISG